MAGKLWGGRFTGATDPLMEEFNDSIGFDQKLWAEDIEGSQAYARALARANMLTAAEAETIVAGLAQVADEWRRDAFVLKAGDEDIHTANERRLTELVGVVAGKLHTGRSRNDQVATDVRLWLRKAIRGLRGHVRELIRVAVDRAEQEIDILMPGYTHLQPAQPIRWSHWLLNHAWAWQRDAQRLDELAARVNVMPLGSGALAGNPFRIDRVALAQDLGFADITHNSMDGVSDRDFIAEFLFWASLTMVHLSKLAEDLIIYSSREFSFVTIADAYSTGSSLMPQKKNADSLELLRGKSGRVMGSMTGVMAMLKGLPSTFNKDMQEDKEPLFDTVLTIDRAVQIACGVIATMEPNVAAMRAALGPEMLATDLAEYLVRKGVPFRETHHVAGAAVQMAELQAIPLSELTLDDLLSLHHAFEVDVRDVWAFEKSVDTRDAAGGTSRRAVQEQIVLLQQWLAEP
ncbi:MAG: argininosuccinate lyase [Caldilineaceae bacterium]